MQLPPSQPPQETPDELKWRTIKVRPTTGRAYLLAGVPFGCETHHPRRRTLPCFASLKGCSLACPLCQFERRYTCWVPLIDTSAAKGHRVVVMGGKRTWLSLEGIAPGAVVCLARGNLERDTVLFSQLPDENLNILHLKKWRPKLPFEIRPYCFHLWQHRELSEAFGLRFYPSIRTEEIERNLRSIEDDPPRNMEP